MGGSDREIVQRAFEAFSRGDIDAVLDLCDPDVVVRDPERTGTTFRGPDGLRQFFEEWLENWEEYRSEPVELTESGDEILVHAIQTGKGKLSGIEIEQDLFVVLRLRDGKFVEYRLYTKREGALASMGAAD
jgi:ketosteroid isomerase-like protein